MDLDQIKSVLADVAGQLQAGAPATPETSDKLRTCIASLKKVITSPDFGFDNSRAETLVVFAGAQDAITSAIEALTRGDRAGAASKLAESISTLEGFAG